MPNDVAISLTTMCLRLLVALGLGLAIGLERQLKERAAGMRTHALVCFGASLVMIVSTYGFVDAFPGGTEGISLDPSRMAAQVVTGIGFLGAGIIIYRRNSVHGLTTAASLWAVAGIGLACGGGLLWLAIIATAFILAMQAFLRPIEKRYFARPARSDMTFALEQSVGPIESMLESVRRSGGEVESIDVRHEDRSAPMQLDIVVSAPRGHSTLAMYEVLAATEGVHGLRYRSRTDESSGDNDDDGRRMAPGRRRGWWTEPVD